VGEETAFAAQDTGFGRDLCYQFGYFETWQGRR
jgi:hypothetical protein